MLLKPATERAKQEHWGKEEFFDMLIVRDVPLQFPPIAAAMMALKVAERHRCSRIRVDQGMQKREFDLQTVRRHLAQCGPGGNEVGVAFPDQREVSRPMWPVGTLFGADGLPKGADD